MRFFLLSFLTLLLDPAGEGRAAAQPVDYGFKLPGTGFSGQFEGQITSGEIA